MLLDSTTDNLEIILGAAITTNQLPFVVSFNDYTSSAVTPTKNVNVTNGSTAVNLVSAPASGHQRQLRYCSIFNLDTVAAAVTIRFNDNGTTRSVFVVTLQPAESIQYTYEAGWKVHDVNGAEKIIGLFFIPSIVRSPEFFASGNITTVLALATTNCYCVYLGKAERAFTSMTLCYRITTAITATVVWAELAIYKGTPTIAASATLTRLGFLSTSGIWNSTGAKANTVTLSGCNAGDDLWVVFSNSTSGTVTSVRAGIVDDVGAGFFQTVSNKQPSANSTLTGVVDSTTAMIWCTWQGS